jgi:hypothetical protein
MLASVEFHIDCAWRSVRSGQMVIAGASMRIATEIASRNAVRVVVAWPSFIGTSS